MKSIPQHLLRDRYWRSLIHLFNNHKRLNSCFTTKFFDIESEFININALKNQAKYWSTSEKIMLNLAFHLFNEQNKFNLSDIDYLDDHNKKLAFEAIKLRFF